MIRYMCCQSEHSKNYLTAEFIFSESLLPKEDLSSRLLRCVVATGGCLFWRASRQLVQNLVWHHLGEGGDDVSSGRHKEGVGWALCNYSHCIVARLLGAKTHLRCCGLSSCLK